LQNALIVPFELVINTSGPHHPVSIDTPMCRSLGEKIMVAKVTNMKPSAKARSKPATKGKVKTMTEGAPYKHHKVGSRKATIHQLFDEEGREVAWTRGIKMGLAENSLRSWFGTWAREAGTGRVKKNARVTAKVKKANGTAEATANA
jgi:hypothetical protein